MSEPLFLTDSGKIDTGDIETDDIDLSDHRYQLSMVRTDISSLSESIRVNGLIQPPIVIRQKSRDKQTGFIIVSGFNRVNACVTNHQKTIHARILPPEIDEYHCLVIAITTLCFKRELHPAELIHAINRLGNFLTADEMADRSKVLFNVGLNTRFIKEMQKIAKLLPDPGLTLLHNGNISLKTVRQLVALSTQDAIELLTVFSQIKASSNKQLEIITNIKDICKRDHLKISTLLNGSSVKQILLNKDSDPLQKTSQLRSYLYELRYPSISEFKKTIEQKIKRLPPHGDIQIQPPDNFEHQFYSFSFRARNYGELKNRIETLEKIKTYNKTGELFSQFKPG